MIPTWPTPGMYGSTPQPHYPSSADLAAFRRRIGGAFSAISPPADTPRRYDDEARPLFTDPLGRPVSGAWADERRDGIGSRDGAHDPGDGWKHAAARREASALRSRDYSDLVRTASRNVECPGHPNPDHAHPSLAAESGIGQRYHVAAWWTERQHGCPTWLPEDATR